MIGVIFCLIILGGMALETTVANDDSVVCYHFGIIPPLIFYDSPCNWSGQSSAPCQPLIYGNFYTYP